MVIDDRVFRVDYRGGIFVQLRLWLAEHSLYRRGIVGGHEFYGLLEI